MKVTRRNFLKTTIGSAVFAGSPAAIAKTAEGTKIPKRKFGRHDDMLTVVGIGGHTLYYTGSQKEANEVVHRAYDLGVNFFENAWGYHKGVAEEYMGNALKGKRENVFLMTKFSNFRGDGDPTLEGAMKHLEDSLRRLKTDYLDLWMMHNVVGNDAQDAYKSDGAIAAIELAKKQGKIRYGGFTGHTEPKIHRDVIEGGYEWDATLMPVSVVGALKSRAFEEDTMPLCKKHNIAVLGMKGFGGSRRTHLHGQTNVEEVLRYALSYDQVCTHVVGIDKVDYVNQAVAASVARPMSQGDRAQFAVNDTQDSPDYSAMMHGGELYEDGCCSRRSQHRA
ncbi:MAG: aldo/keto reductase [Puniceicoccaceae bacterium]|nr:aldo/keto reductase [Puniceicoccaceae bacterium]